MSLSSPISARTTRFIETTVNADIDDVQARLSRRRIVLELDPAYATSFPGQAILFTVLNLLVRLDAYCPVVDVVLPAVPRHPLLRLLTGDMLGDGLRAFFSPFPAAERLTIGLEVTASQPADLQLMISPHPTDTVLSVWADGWIAYLNMPAPVGPWDENIVGAAVAAGLATAEVFKRLIMDIPLRPGVRIIPTNQLVFSTFDYRLAAGSNPALPAAINVDGVALIGVGGIGSAFVAAATSLPRLTGHLALVDEDTLDITNQNRFLVARPGDQGAKVDLCREALAFHPDITVHEIWFEEFSREHPRLDLAVVGVDHDKVRREVQASLPRLILNAGTSDTASFRVTRHAYLDGACLSCIARDDLRPRPVERELARKLGLSLETIMAYQVSGESVPADILQRAANLSATEIEQLAGRSLAEIQQRVCAELRIGGKGEQQEAAVSISFLSALPGFLLLGEVIKEQSYPELDRPPLNATINHALLAVLGRPGQSLLHGRREKRSGCDCGRSVYQRHYRRKWLDRP